MNRGIDHTGVVEKIQSGYVTIRIRQTSACASCSAAHLCKTSDSSERLIDVYDDNASSFRIGDVVQVKGSTRQGLKAVVIAYLFPLLFLLLFLVIAHAIGLSDALASVISLVLLIVYYAVLFLFRGRIKRVITFKITNISKTNL
jgi:sigma-E factor negative regulatory protein RseC